MAHARLTDNMTSWEAADGVERSGRAGRQRERCLHVVRHRPGLTAAEIAVVTGLERHVPSRRLPELRTAKLVENREDRVCRVKGRRSMTWWPVDGVTRATWNDIMGRKPREDLGRKR